MLRSFMLAVRFVLVAVSCVLASCSRNAESGSARGTDDNVIDVPHVLVESREDAKDTHDMPAPRGEELGNEEPLEFSRATEMAGTVELVNTGPNDICFDSVPRHGLGIALYRNGTPVPGIDVFSRASKPGDLRSLRPKESVKFSFSLLDIAVRIPSGRYQMIVSIGEIDPKTLESTRTRWAKWVDIVVKE